jgi:hypothetical protein
VITGTSPALFAAAASCGALDLLQPANRPMLKTVTTPKRVMQSIANLRIISRRTARQQRSAQ